MTPVLIISCWEQGVGNALLEMEKPFLFLLIQVWDHSRLRALLLLLLLGFGNSTG